MIFLKRSFKVFFYPLIIALITTTLSYYVTQNPIISLYVLIVVLGFGIIIYLIGLFYYTIFIQSNVSGIVRIYRNQSEAEKEIAKCIAFAQEIDILAVRGLGIASLRDSVIQKGLRATENEVRVRIAYLDKASIHCKTRASEIGESLEEFTSALQAGYSGLSQLRISEKLNVEFKVYDQLPVWRIIRVDDTMFVTGFLNNKNGHDVYLYQIQRRNDFSLFPILKREFDEIWRNSRTPD